MYDNNSFLVNLNKVKILKNLIPELVESNEPPIITKIKKINVKSNFESEKYIPIFEILVVIPNNNKGKLFSLKKTNKIKVTVIKYNNK